LDWKGLELSLVFPLLVTPFQNSLPESQENLTVYFFPILEGIFRKGKKVLPFKGSSNFNLGNPQKRFKEGLLGRAHYFIGITYLEFF